MEHESDDSDVGGVALADSGPAERRSGGKRRDERPATPDPLFTVSDYYESERDGPSASRQPIDPLPDIIRRNRMPLSPHVGFASNDNDVGGHSAASPGPSGRHMGTKRRETPHTRASPKPGLVYRRPGSQRTVRRSWYEPTSTASNYAEMLSWLPPLAAPPGMALAPVESRPFQGPEVQEPDPELEKMRTEMHAMQTEISRSRLRDDQAREAEFRTELVQRIRQEEEEKIKNRMDAMREAQEIAKKEIELMRIAAEAAARERLEEAREAENERHRALAGIKAEAARQERERIRIEERDKEVRAREHANMLAGIELKTIAKLKTEESKKEEVKLQLDKERAFIELETRIKFMAELKEQEKVIAAEESRQRWAEEFEAMERKCLEAEILNKATRTERMVELKYKEEATAAEESRKRWTEELEAREREVLKAEIMNKCSEELIAREKAVFEAEMESKYARQAQLDARERAIIEMESRYRYAADLAALWEESSSTDDSESTETSFGSYPMHHDASSETPTGSYSTSDGVAPENSDDNSHKHSTVDIPGHSTQSYFTNSPSSKDRESVKPSHSNEISQGETPSIMTPEANVFGAHGIPVGFDAVYHLANTSDITVHIDLDLYHDIGDELEEFSRLSRIGSFARAESYFDLHLRTHLLHNPLLFVQYADMLLEKGDYRSLMSLDDSSVFMRRDPQESEGSDGELDQLEMNWRLIRGNALCHTQHNLHVVREVVKDPFRSVRDMSHIGSTELRNLALTIRLNKLTARSSNRDVAVEIELSDWADWRRIYWQLLSEGRIWDFRDAFVAVSESYGTKNALDAFLGDYSDSSVEGLLLDWRTDQRDESTELALLDLLAFKALSPDTSPDAGHLRETCLRLAEPIGKSLLNNCPHTVRSRIFIQWVISKSVVGSKRENFKYLADYGGHTVFAEFEPGMPYYVPKDAENPGWLPPVLTSTARQSLEMALRASQETQDYRTEARCLQELSLGTQDPDGPLQALAELQTSKQHDMNGYLATCLTRYLTCENPEAKRTLLENMKSLGFWENPSDQIDPAMARARNVLWRVLTLGSLGSQLSSTIPTNSPESHW